MTTHAATEGSVSVGTSIEALRSSALAPTAGPASGGRTRARGGQRSARAWGDHATLAAIGLVVVLVSLPRLRSFAVRENETDAVRMLSIVAAENTRGASADWSVLLAPGAALERRLGDVELLPGQRVRRHGYLFDRALAADGGEVLRAWPWSHGHTGLGAFVLRPGRGVFGHANTDGRFSGPDDPPPVDGAPASGWVPMSRF